jgi:hypothetical protein
MAAESASAARKRARYAAADRRCESAIRTPGIVAASQWLELPRGADERLEIRIPRQCFKISGPRRRREVLCARRRRQIFIAQRRRAAGCCATWRGKRDGPEQ